MSWLRDRRHDLERWFKRKVVKKLVRVAKAFWDDIEPELEEILLDAKDVGEDILEAAVDEFKGMVTARTREEMDRLRTKLDGLREL